MKTHKTNAARLLDAAGLAYELVPYEVDDNDLSASHLAAQLGLDPDRIFKTLVLRGDKTGFFVCVIPGSREVDLKKAAKASGNKNCAMIPMKDLQAVTGYLRGGCSPIGMKKRFPTFIDGSVSAFDSVFVSAGQRGLQFKLSPEALLQAVGGTSCLLTGTP